MVNKKTLSCGCLFKEAIKNASHKKLNIYNLENQYGIGYTSNGKEFYFDLEDYDKIKDYCWRIKSDGYIVSSMYFDTDCKKQIFLHRLIMDCCEDNTLVVDHMNHERNDNRKSNLRIITTQQNNMNNSLRKDNKSSVTGVFWNKQNNVWQAQIRINKKNIYLGCFKNINDAIKVRKEAEEKYFGEYSYDNSIKKASEINA